MKQPSILFLALVLAGCGSNNNDTGYFPLPYLVDEDNDLHFAGLDDCDDSDPSVHADAEEICDGIDNDCSGVTDGADATGAISYYQDLDQDTYGDDKVVMVDCTAPDGFVDRGGDCNDNDALFHPYADESVCSDPNDYNCDGSVGYADVDKDGVAACLDCNDADALVSPNAPELCSTDYDDNCDTQINEDTASDATTWYIDYDQDSYGSATQTETACEQPKLYIDNANDCDDLSATVYPGATEYCNGIDDDCDLAVDESDAVDSIFFYLDADGDDFGDFSNAQLACIAPKGYVADSTDCDDTAATVYPGASEYCNGIDDDCDRSTDEGEPIDATLWWYDADQDGFGGTSLTRLACDEPIGYVDNFEDCNDLDTDIYPGAPEYCDTLDNNCNMVVDELPVVDPNTYYADIDQDAFGDPLSPIEECNAPNGYVTDNTDCDDTLDTVNPDAIERCSTAGIDDDCDGVVDEADASDTTTWFVDRDGDGYGGFVFTQNACTQPAGTAPNPSDCLDTDPAVYPGAVEVCNGLDDDCSGIVDDNDPADARIWYYDIDDDTYGDPNNSVVACQRQVQTVEDSTDCDDGSASVSPGAPEICNNGIDDDCNPTATRCEAFLNGASGIADAAWYAEAANENMALSANFGDLNNDSYDDIVLASIENSHNGSRSGTTYVLYGPFTGPSSVYLADFWGASPPNGVALYGTYADDGTGADVSGGEDLTGDGLPDLVITAPTRKPTPSSLYTNGAAYIIEGPIDAGGSLDTVAMVRLDGASTNERAGQSCGLAGDVNGDGMDDLVVAANKATGGASNSGRVYLMQGPILTTDRFSTADGIFNGEASNDRVGTYLTTGAGDVNADGFDDIMIGSNNYLGGLGGVYIVNGQAGAYGAAISLASADAVFVGQVSASGTGVIGARAGDDDGDGYDDIMLSAYLLQSNGAAYLIHGSSLTALEQSANPSEVLGTGADDVVFQGINGENFGSAIGAHTDFDQDGFNDYIIGAHSGIEGGTGYLFYGPVTGTIPSTDAAAMLLGASQGDNLGATASFVPDATGAGDPAILLVADHDDTTGYNAGAAFMLFDLEL